MPEARRALLSDLAKEACGQRWFSTQENNVLFLAAGAHGAAAYR